MLQTIENVLTECSHLMDFTEAQALRQRIVESQFSEALLRSELDSTQGAYHHLVTLSISITAYKDYLLDLALHNGLQPIPEPNHIELRNEMAKRDSQTLYFALVRLLREVKARLIELEMSVKTLQASLAAARDVQQAKDALVGAKDGEIAALQGSIERLTAHLEESHQREQALVAQQQPSATATGVPLLSPQTLLSNAQRYINTHPDQCDMVKCLLTALFEGHYGDAVARLHYSSYRAVENDRLLPADALAKARQALHPLCDDQDYIEEFIHQIATQSDTPSLMAHVIGPMFREHRLRYERITAKDLVSIVRLCLTFDEGASQSNLEKQFGHAVKRHN